MTLAWPMALTQLGHVAMMTTDLALIGRLGDVAVAAAALGQIVMFGAFVLGMGLVSAVAPLTAQGFGARNPRLVRRALRAGLWAAVFAGIPLTAVQLAGEPLLLAAGQSAELSALAGRYLAGLALSLIPAWWFIALRSFMGSVNRPEPALWITLVAIPANAVLAYVLIHGAFGMPRLDLLGAGLATTIVSFGMCIAAVWVCYACRPFKKYQILGRFWRLHWPVLRQLIIIGAPMSGTFALEYGLFAAAGLLMGWIGTAALAAHQIALTVASIIFMVPLGIGMAATVRVGQAAGRSDAAASRRAGMTAIAMGAAFMVTMVLAVIATRDFIPALFLGGITEANAQTAALASTLLLLGSTFFIADGVQTVAAGALRGLNDTRVPLLIAAVSFWLVGFTASYGLGFPAGLNEVGVWIGFTVGLVIYAVLLVWRFHRLSRQGYLPEVAQAGKAPAGLATPELRSVPAE
jgi:multidrug resistance protein, MATE family